MFADLLNWLSSADGGAFIIVTWAVSWALEEAAWWHALTSKTRSLAVLGVSIVLALGATVLQQNPELVAAIEPYFVPVYYTVGAWLATQAAHKGYKLLSNGVQPVNSNVLEVHESIPAHELETRPE